MIITILTPTYNRVSTLERLYRSIVNQSGNFEWVLVDDGSTDTTADFAQMIMKENKISFQYIKQNNQGKHIAINTGVNHAIGSWIFIVDSDDYLKDRALSILNEGIKKYGSKYELCYRKELISGELVGKKIQSSEMIMSATDAGRILQGDLAYIFKTSTLKEFPFPYISTEKFVPELYVWNQIADKYPIMFFLTKSIYVCEYRDDGYSKNFKKNLQSNPMGFLLFYRNQISREKSMLSKIKYLIRCIQCLYYIK